MRRHVDDSDLADLIPSRAPPAPAVSDPRFWANVERWESEPWNRAGAEKRWVDRLHDGDDTCVGTVVREEPALESRARLFRELERGRVRYLLIGVGGADVHAEKLGERLLTKDLDLFLPRSAENLLACWEACERARYTLWSRGEPLDQPRDLWLARRVVSFAALTTAQPSDGVPADLTFVMGAFEFEDVWLRRTEGFPDGVGVDLARFADIVAAKRHAGRDKDLRFLQENADLVARILAAEGPPGNKP
jgi:hypothetical protein